MNESSLPPRLSAKYTDSFAFPTMKDRIPVILSKIADHLNRNRDVIVKEHGGDPTREELKTLIGSMSQLRYEVMTNKSAAPLRDSHADVPLWNAELVKEVEKQNGEPMKWFDSAWLWMECYLYRRIYEAVLLGDNLRGFDVFADQKQAAFFNSYKAVSTLTMCLLEVLQTLEETKIDLEVKKYFLQFLQVSLWGNKCDLSISAGHENHQENCLLEQLTTLKSKVLIDEAEVAFQILHTACSSRGGQPGRVDFVLDNAGFELLTDLCLAEFLVSAGLASRIHFHVKAIPWFVSDVTEQDFMWTLKQMSSMNHLAISQLSHKWRSRLQEGTWVVEVNDFWTLPNDYSQMKVLYPKLYADLGNADLIFFKGDLNYRKLVGDLKWDSQTEFSNSLRGFGPAPLCVLRTLKSDVVVGLIPGQASELKRTDKDWMINGEWAVISVSKGTLISS